MYIDMHMHEKRHSKDSFLMLEEMVAIAKQKGLDGICVTDHESMGLRAYAKEYSKETNFPIFVGVEYFSLEGDIVAFGLDKVPKDRIGAQSFVDLVKAQGGVCISVHPFRNNNRGLEEHLKEVNGLDGIEVLNGSTVLEANKKAARYAKDLGLFSVASSDCHTVEKVGVFATYFENWIQTEEELIEALKEGKTKPAYYKNGKYQIWDWWEKLL